MAPQDVDPTIEFTTVRRLNRQIDRQIDIESDILIVKGVPVEVFEPICDRERRYHHIRLRRYYADTHLLIIAIPTALHETLQIELYSMFSLKLWKMNTRRLFWNPFGATTFCAQRHPPHRDNGEADSSGGPVPEGGIPDVWPALVIEAGVSASLTRLRQDMRWWFPASGYEVKIVLLAKFDRAQNNAILEKWEAGQEQLRPGATMTRSAAARAPIKRQSLTITQDATTNPPTYNVTGGTLKLDFALLFGREPNQAQEGDIVWTEEDMQRYAKRVWAML